MAKHFLEFDLALQTARRCAAVLLLLAGAVSSCTSGERHDDVMDHAAAATDTTMQTYSAVGRVTAVTPDRDFLMIRHDTIQGFMDAMTMPFAVRDTSVVSGIAAGDSVGFELEVSADEVYLVSIEKR